MNQLKEYIIALVNLYGMVHKDTVVEIYNKQNEEQISVSEVESLLADTPKELDDAFVHTQKDYFVHETIHIYNEFDLMLRKRWTSLTTFRRKMSCSSTLMMDILRKQNSITHY